MSSQSSRLWPLCYTAAPHRLSVWHLVMCMFQCSFLNLSHSLLTPRPPIPNHYVLSLCAVYENMSHSYVHLNFTDSVNLHRTASLLETWTTGLAGIVFLWHCRGRWINLNVKFLNHSTFSLKKKTKQNNWVLKKHLTTYLLYLYEQSYYCANNELPQESDGCISGSHSQ